MYHFTAAGGGDPKTPSVIDGGGSVDFTVTFTTTKLGISIAVAASINGNKALTVHACSPGTEGDIAGVQSKDVLVAVNGEVFDDLNAMFCGLQSSKRPMRVGFKRPGGCTPAHRNTGDAEDSENVSEEASESAVFIHRDAIGTSASATERKRFEPRSDVLDDVIRIFCFVCVAAVYTAVIVVSTVTAVTVMLPGYFLTTTSAAAYPTQVYTGPLNAENRYARERFAIILRNDTSDKLPDWIQMEGEVLPQSHSHRISESVPIIKWIVEHYNELPTYVVFLHGPQESWHTAQNLQALIHDETPDMALMLSKPAMSWKYGPGGQDHCDMKSFPAYKVFGVKEAMNTLCAVAFNRTWAEVCRSTRAYARGCCTEVLAHNKAILSVPKATYSAMLHEMTEGKHTDEYHWGNAWEYLMPVLWDAASIPFTSERTEWRIKVAPNDQKLDSEHGKRVDTSMYVSRQSGTSGEVEVRRRGGR